MRRRCFLDRPPDLAQPVHVLQRQRAILRQFVEQVGHFIVHDCFDPFADLGQRYTLTLRNGVLTHRNDQLAAQADLTVTLDKATLDQISLRKLDFPTAIKQGAIKLDGDGKKLGEFLGMIDSFKPQFNIVTP